MNAKLCGALSLDTDGAFVQSSTIVAGDERRCGPGAITIAGSDAHLNVLNIENGNSSLFIEDSK
jgi:hypothetical protein